MCANDNFENRDGVNNEKASDCADIDPNRMDTLSNTGIKVAKSWSSGTRIVICFLLLCAKRASSQDAGFSGTSETIGMDGQEFLERCRRDCAIQRSLMACGRYRTLQWINYFVEEKQLGYGPIKLIKIPPIQEQRLLPEIPRRGRNSSMIIDTLQFVRDSAEKLLTRRAVVYAVDQPQGARSLSTGVAILDEEQLERVQTGRAFFDDPTNGDFRLFKKKKYIIFPLLILLNLVKIKLLILPILFGIHFIKKILVVASLLIPSILAHLKVCRVPHHPYPHIPWAPPDPHDYSGGYGHDDWWDSRNDVYPSPYSASGSSLYNPWSFLQSNHRRKR